MHSRSTWFARFAQHVSHVTGRPIAFIGAVTAILLWAATGPLFGYSDTWQLVINTATTIITFLMVFVIQNTQIRDTIAMQIKLDELIRAVHGARNAIIATDLIPEEDVEQLQKEFEAVARRAQAQSRRRSSGTSRANGKGTAA